MNAYVDLFWTFAKIGAVTFGGGYAMLPLLQRDVVERKGWVTDAEILDYYAVGQCLPGLIAVNTSLFIGERQKGAWGGVAAALGVAFPSLIVIMAIAAFIQGFSDLPMVQNAFAGIRACVLALILDALLRLRKAALVDKISIVIFFVVMIGSILLKLSPVVFVVAAGLAGILLRGRKASV